MSASARLNWGIISTGTIAATFAKGVACSQSGKVVAVASRSQATAEQFAFAHGISRAHGSYDDLFADPEVEAIYIATPHPQHAECAENAARAGKAVLCEKPLGLNGAQALAIVEAAKANNVLLMEAYMYRCHPQTAKIIEIVKSGVLGKLGLIQATFSFYTDFNPASRLWSRALAGGGILDVGGYPTSLARLLAGASEGKSFLNPLEVSAAGLLHEVTGIDVYTAATFKFETGLVAQVSCGVGLQQDNSARIYGTNGWLHVPEPWLPSPQGGTTSMFLHRRDRAEPEQITITSPTPLYTHEADIFAAAFHARAKEVSAMPWSDTLGNAQTLDRWRDAIG